jgi:hypothetical protein
MVFSLLAKIVEEGGIVMSHLRKKLFPYIAFLGFIGFLFGNSTIVAKSKNDIVTMTDIIQHEKYLNMDEWSVYAREKNTNIRNRNEFQATLLKLQGDYPHFHWNTKEELHGLKASGTFDNAAAGLTESIELVSTLKKSHPVTYIIYEVKGHFWEKRNAAFFENSFQIRLNDIFRGNPSIFSCVKGIFSDNIDTVLTSKTGKLLDLFKAEEIESIKEKDFVSVSAHTDMFARTLSMEKLNLQVGLRTEGLGGKTTFVVGTPIVTFEY